jgi:hypothetical protein
MQLKPDSLNDQLNLPHMEITQTNKQNGVNNKRGPHLYRLLFVLAISTCTSVHNSSSFIFRILLQKPESIRDRLSMRSIGLKDILNAYPFESDASP